MAKGSGAAREAWQYIAELWMSDENFDRFRGACEAVDLPPPQTKALLSLEPGEPRPMRDLAIQWRCDASWVTGIVDGLEQRGYVERVPHPTDRRVKVVQLTKLGAQAKQRALDRLNEPPPSLLTLTAEEQRLLRDLLRKARTDVARPPA